jgi:hypothetical protein
MEATMPHGRPVCAALLALMTLFAPVLRAADEVTADEVRTAIRRGVEYLKSQQDKVNGSWPEHPGQPGGMTALCTLALLTAGESPASREMQLALNYLRGLPDPTDTYAVALQTMALAAAEPEKDRAIIARNARWLENAQMKDGPQAGMWGYKFDGRRADNSNTQFALLALYEAERVGIGIEPNVWRLSLEHFRSTQRADGSWTYFEQQPPLPSTGSMTCAGVGSMLICSDRLGLREAEVLPNGSVQCCGLQSSDDHIERGIAWLGKQSLNDNPGMSAWHLYYLYGIERVGRLSGRRFLGDLDWYRSGAAVLLRSRDTLNGQWKGGGIIESNPVLGTSFALLFLAKGKRPILISQLEWTSDQDWNRHPAALHNLTRRVEERWRRDLAWQTIRLKYASVQELMETPVLFLRGTSALRLTQEQKAALKDFVGQGGFVLAEACDGDGCDGRAFDASFRQLMEEIFPDSPLRPLPPEHAVWYAEEKVDPRHLPSDMWMYGIDACCRTSVMYVNKSLSCYWELHAGKRTTDYPPQVTQRIEACMNLGQNIVAYATNRELKEKLDAPLVRLQDQSDSLRRGTLAIPKLNHTGGADEATHALANLLLTVREQAEIRVNTERLLLSPTDLAIFDHPVLFMHGRRSFRFSPAERQALAEYLQRGGFVFGDAICASPQFAESFRREFEATFPDARFVTLPPDHPLYSQQYRGALLDRVTVRDPQIRNEGDPLKANLVQLSPVLEGLEIDGRLAVVFSPLDLSCALENQSSLECKGYIKADAARLGVNIILFALGQ